MIIGLSVASTLIVAGATVVLVCLTGRYVRLTKAIVDDMKEAREPDVFVDFECPENMMRLVVGNAGQSAAKDVRFEVVSDVDCVDSLDGEANVGLAKLPVLQNGVSYLTPGRTLKFYAGVLRIDKEDSASETFRVKVCYKNDSGKRFDRDVVIDMNQYRNVLFESFRDSILTVAKAIEDAERRRSIRERHGSPMRMFQRKKRCPMCAEQIEPSARKCPHCREWVEGGSQPDAAADG